MIKATMNIGPVMSSLGADLAKLGPGGRHNIFSVAANAVKILVQRHLLRIAPSRHLSVSRLPGAQPTGHLAKGARAVTFTSTSDSGSVIIPIAGISRAFHDVTIAPRDARMLTIPIHADAYGRKAKEVRSLGWRLFRARSKAGNDLLFGTRDGETKPLYLLKTAVRQRRDRGLLPSDREIGVTASMTVIEYLKRRSA